MEFQTLLKISANIFNLRFTKFHSSGSPQFGYFAHCG
jgi:hypothetical protein